MVNIRENFIIESVIIIIILGIILLVVPSDKQDQRRVLNNLKESNKVSALITLSNELEVSESIMTIDIKNGDETDIFVKEIKFKSDNLPGKVTLHADDDQNGVFSDNDNSLGEFTGSKNGSIIEFDLSLLNHLIPGALSSTQSAQKYFVKGNNLKTLKEIQIKLYEKNQDVTFEPSILRFIDENNLKNILETTSKTL